MFISSQATRQYAATRAQSSKSGPDDVDPEFPERHTEPGPDDVYDPDMPRRGGGDSGGGSPWFNEGGGGGGFDVLF